jgi:hypothetical protein
MSGARFETGPASFGRIPEATRQMHERAVARALALADEVDTDDPGVRREFAAWLRARVADDLAGRPDGEVEHLVMVAQRALELALRWRAGRYLLLVLWRLILAGIDEAEDAFRGVDRDRGRPEAREHLARGDEHVAATLALRDLFDTAMDRICVLAAGLYPRRSDVILDRLPPDLVSALRDADWPTLVPLGLAHAAGLRADLESREPGIMATAEEALRRPNVREALDRLARDRRRGPGPGGWRDLEP